MTQSASLPKPSLLRRTRWLAIPLGLLLASWLWPAWPRSHTLVLDLGPGSEQLERVELEWSVVGEEPRGATQWSFVESTPPPRRLRQQIDGPSGEWQLGVRRQRRGSLDKTISEHRVTLKGEETVLFLKDSAR